MTSQAKNEAPELPSSVTEVALRILSRTGSCQEENWKDLVGLLKSHTLLKAQLAGLSKAAGLPNQVVLMASLVAAGNVSVDPALVKVPQWLGIVKLYTARKLGVEVTVANVEDLARKASAIEKAKSRDPVKDLERAASKFLDLLKESADKLPTLVRNNEDLQKVYAMLRVAAPQAIGGEGARPGVSLGANPRSKNSAHRSGAAPRRQPQHGPKDPPSMKVNVPPMTKVDDDVINMNVGVAMALGAFIPNN